MPVWCWESNGVVGCDDRVMSAGRLCDGGVVVWRSWIVVMLYWCYDDGLVVVSFSYSHALFTVLWCGCGRDVARMVVSWWHGE